MNRIRQFFTSALLTLLWKGAGSEKSIEEEEQTKDKQLEMIIKMMPIDISKDEYSSNTKIEINILKHKYYCSKDEANPDKLFDASYFPGKQCHKCKYWKKSSELLSSARLLGPRISQAKRQQLWVDLLNRQADKYRRTYKYQESIECYQQLKRFYEDANQEQTEAMMVLWVNMGMVYEMQGKLKQALQIYESMVQESIRITRNVHPEAQIIAFCMSHAARVSQYFKDYQKSERYTMEAERIWKNIDYPNYKIYKFENLFRASRIYHKRQQYEICLIIVFNFIQLSKYIWELKLLVKMAEKCQKDWVIQVANKHDVGRNVYRQALQIIQTYQNKLNSEYRDTSMQQIKTKLQKHLAK